VLLSGMGAGGASSIQLPRVSEREDRIPQGIQRQVVRVCTVRSDEEMIVVGKYVCLSRSFVVNL
jgi:hypothetical protein